MNNKHVVDSFYECWSAGDVDGAKEFCAEEIIWDNVPMDPITGKDKVSYFLKKDAKGMKNPRYDVLNQMEAGDPLLMEGIENYTRQNIGIRSRYMTAFEFEDNLIKIWRDYFDLATVEHQLAINKD